MSDTDKIVILNNHIFPHNVSTSVYVGRGTPLGNPFIIGKHGDRDEVIRKYRRWLWEQIRPENNVNGESEALTALKGLLVIYKAHGELGLKCFCAPKPCHADIIKKAILWLEKTQSKEQSWN